MMYMMHEYSNIITILLSSKINVFSIGIITQPLHIYVPKRMLQFSMNNHASYTSLLNSNIGLYSVGILYQPFNSCKNVTRILKILTIVFFYIFLFETSFHVLLNFLIFQFLGVFGSFLCLFLIL